jgi:hypothetical protein
MFKIGQKIMPVKEEKDVSIKKLKKQQTMHGEDQDMIIEMIKFREEADK